jgi:hypothetical protein
VTKSFVALAIGLLEEEGKIALTDKVTKCFPEAAEYDIPDEISEQTIYDLLTMRTSFVKGQGGHWVRDKAYDRIKAYFTEKPEKANGTFFNYDSRGSYVLGVIAERVTGKPFMEYLKEKILLRIGFSKDSACISDPTGYSWSDSGLLCTAEDLYRTGKFINQGGVWNGERLMNEKFLRDATSAISSSCVSGNDSDNNTHGYGYQIWHEIMDGFGFHGMGMQYMICIPKLDFYLVCNADTQGNDNARAIFIDMYEDFVKEEIHDEPLPENAADYDALLEYCKNLELTSLSCNLKSEMQETINAKTFVLNNNPMGIKQFTLHFDGECGSLIYENAQGEKRLPFGIGKNVIVEFPEDGYADMKIGYSPDGYHYPCAVSAAWQDERTFALKVQVIGNHLGGMYARFGFDKNRASLDMRKTTNCFLNSYEGSAIGYRRD